MRSASSPSGRNTRRTDGERSTIVTRCSRRSAWSPRPGASGLLVAEHQRRAAAGAENLPQRRVEAQVGKLQKAIPLLNRHLFARESYQVGEATMLIRHCLWQTSDPDVYVT